MWAPGRAALGSSKAAREPLLLVVTHQRPVGNDSESSNAHDSSSPRERNLGTKANQGRAAQANQAPPGQSAPADEFLLPVRLLGDGPQGFDFSPEAQFGKGFRLQLPDSLPTQLQAVADFLQGHRLARLQAVAHPDDPLLVGL